MEAISPEFMAQMIIIGMVGGFLFAMRKVIAWAILILGIFIGLLLMLDGPVRNTLNENWEGSGDSMMEWVDETVFFWVDEEEEIKEEIKEESE
jgi:hypothetical protein